MKSKNLIILAVVVALFAAYMLLFERHQLTSDEAANEAEKILQGFERDDVVGIVVESDAGRVRLEKVEEDWRLREPLDFPADSTAVDSALVALAGLTADRRLDAGEIELAEYGLDDPPAKVTLQMEDGSEIVLAIGDEMPLGAKRPVRLGDAGEIVVAQGYFMLDIELELDDWRSREVVDLAEDQIASIDIDTDTDHIRAVRLDDDWRLVSPLEDTADGEHLRNLVTDLGALRIQEFLEPGVDPGDLGLVAPEYEIMVVRSDGGEAFRLDLGATREGETGTEVACRRGDGEYFWALDRVRIRLSKAPVLWRAKKVMPFETWNAEKFRLVRGEESAELEQTDGVWHFVDEGGEADLTEVQQRLRKLSDLEATDYDLMAPMTSELGRAEVVLEAADGESEPETLSFTFYAPLEAGGRAMVRAAGRETIMGVDAAKVDEIFADIDALRPDPVEELTEDSQ